MAADPLFDEPHDRLGARLHADVFGALPTSTARALDVPEVAAAVRRLLARRWRPSQLAARVGAAPTGEDPVTAVLAFLQALLERDSPEQAWDRERLERARAAEAARDPGHQPASDEARARWVAEARRSLGLPARPRPVAPPPSAPRCSSCDGPGELFVTRRVRLCPACVEALAAGGAAVQPRPLAAPAARAG